MKHQVYLSLGTNLGQRRHNLERAIAGLQEVVLVTAVSPLYETVPWGVVEQPDFYNVCVAGLTDYAPQELLTFVKQLEMQLGRTPTSKWGPRLIDIDILLIDDLIMHVAGLTIPHLGIAERAFVVIPLADIAPEVRHPEFNLTIQELATAVSSTGIRRLPDPLVVDTAVTV